MPASMNTAPAATAARRHPARCRQLSVYQQARHDTACNAAADDEKVEISALRAPADGHRNATPRASFGMRPEAPVLKRDKADLAGGNTSKASNPKFRSRWTAPSGFENTRINPSVKAMMPPRSA